MSSVCTLRLKRRRAFSRGSPSCTRTCSKENTPPNGPKWGNTYPGWHTYITEYATLGSYFCSGCGILTGTKMARQTRKMERQESDYGPRDRLDRLGRDWNSATGEVPGDRSLHRPVYRPA